MIFCIIKVKIKNKNNLLKAKTIILSDIFLQRKKKELCRCSQQYYYILLLFFCFAYLITFCLYRKL